MGTGAFSGCVNLREIELPTTLVATCLNQTNISDETFCKTALTTIDLKNVTRMGSNTFKECPNLSHIDLKKIQYFASDVFPAKSQALIHIDLNAEFVVPLLIT